MGFGVRDVGSPGSGRSGGGATGVESLEVDDDGMTEGGGEFDGGEDAGDASVGGEEDGDALGAAVSGDLPDGGDGETADEESGGIPAAGKPASPAIDPAELAKMQAFYAEFGQHADAIRGTVARGFQPAPAMQQQAQAPPAAPYVDPWADQKAYNDFWQKSTDDPRVFREGLHREFEQAPGYKKLLERLDRLDKEFPAIKQGVDQTRGRVMFDNWIKANKAEAFSARIEELIDKVGVKDVNIAFDIAKREALAAKYEKAEKARLAAAKGGKPAAAGARRADDDDEAPARRKPIPPQASGARNRSVGGKGSSTAAAKVTHTSGSGSLMRAAVGAASREMKSPKKK